MRITSNVAAGRLEFNDLGKVIKAVTPQDRLIALNPGDSMYLTDGTDVMYSAQYGDIYKFGLNNMIIINDTVTIAAGLNFVVNHGFNFVPRVTVAIQTGVTPNIIYTDVTGNPAKVTIVTNQAMTQTTITNTSGAQIVAYIRVS